MPCFASDVIKTAQNEIGYKEKKSNSNLNQKTANAGSNNYTKYAEYFDKQYPEFYNTKKNGHDWCDIFVDWCFIVTFGFKDALRLTCQPEKSLGAGCTYSLRYYKKMNKLFKTPEIGDQIFFSKTSDIDKCSHTGIVCDVDRLNVYTIEGNSSNQVAARSYRLTDKTIVGYGRPDYDQEDSEDVDYYVNNFVALNCRSLPSMSSKIVKVYNKNTKIHITRIQNSWGKTQDGWISLTYTRPIENKKIAVGSKVKVKENSKTYTGNKLSKSVYSNTYDVIQINNDRVVIGKGKQVTAAMNIKDLILQ